MSTLATTHHLATLIDPMTDFAARARAQRDFRAAVAAALPIERRELLEDIVDLIKQASLDLRAGVRPENDIEGLVMAREQLLDF